MPFLESRPRTSLQSATTSSAHPGNSDYMSSGSRAWCKRHGEEFKSEKIPFGALIYFKPSAARKRDQSHKFDPKGILGIFPGYEITTGVKWSRLYKVWAASDMTKQNYPFDFIEKLKLKHPHLTERIAMHLPVTFPCKEVYERMNTTLDGLAVRDRLDGSPDFIHDQEIPGS